jgi:hypothetical protein
MAFVYGRNQFQRKQCGCILAGLFNNSVLTAEVTIQKM